VACAGIATKLTSPAPASQTTARERLVIASA
jgi:hypothetical protein